MVDQDAIDEARAPYGCVDDAAGRAVLDHLDVLAKTGAHARPYESDDELGAHVARCAACAAEVADARAALAELEGATVAAMIAGTPVAPTLTVHVSCVYCHDRLARPEAVYCASCLAPHHAGCFSQHGRCAVRGCEDARFVRPVDVPPAAPARRFRWPWLLSAAAMTVGAAALVADRRQVPALDPLPVVLDAPAPPTPPPAERDPVVATVDGEALRRSDVDHACALVPGYLELPGALAQRRARLDALDRLIDDRVVLSFGRLTGLPVSVNVALEANDDYNRLAAPHHEGFDAALAGVGLSAPRVHGLLRDRRLAELIVSANVSREISITPADVHRYYADHLSEFQRGGEVRFRELVLHPDVRDGERVSPRVGPLVPANTAWFPEALRKLRLELTMLSTSGDFEALARAWSMDSPEVQTFVASELDRALTPPLDQVILALKPGQVSAPIELYTGSVHVVHLLSRQDPIAQPLAEVEEQLRARLVDERWRERCAEWVRERRALATVDLEQSAGGPR